MVESYHLFFFLLWCPGAKTESEMLFQRSSQSVSCPDRLAFGKRQCGEHLPAPGGRRLLFNWPPVGKIGLL